MDTTLPPHEQRLLLATVVGREPGACRPGELSDDESRRFDALVARRLAGEPLQHLTGEAYFRYETVAVGPGVFIPRPETEVMTGWALDWLGEHGGRRVVELCAGSGAISLALAHERPGLQQWAVEISDDALPWLERNLAGTGVDVVHADMADALRELDGTVDLVVCNPPYIPIDAWDSLPPDVRDHDPHLALLSGDDGLDAMRVLARVAARLLRPGGAVCAEHAEVQHVSAVQIFVDAGYAEVRDHQDLTRRWRFVTATHRGNNERIRP